MPTNQDDNISTEEFESIDKCYYSNLTLPNATYLFDRKIPSLKEAIKTAIVVLDTNVLLLPYSGKMDIQAVFKIYKNLKTKKRLLIPGQVAREFNKNRPIKISEMYKSIFDKISTMKVSADMSFSVLEGLSEYKDILSALASIKEAKADLDKLSKELTKKIKEWEWNDPVAIEYGQLFTSDIIVDLPFDFEQEYDACKKRYELNIPPGYKDKAKKDSGIGDYLIWKTILQIGESYQKPLIFVTGEEKSDWQHRSNKTGLMPRYELFDESAMKASLEECNFRSSDNFTGW